MATPSSSSWGSHNGLWGRTLTTLWSSLLSTEEALPLPLAVFCCFGGTPSFSRTNYPSSNTTFSFFLFFRLAGANGLTKGEWGGGRGKGGWDLEASLGVTPWPCLRGAHANFSSYSKTFHLLLPLNYCLCAQQRTQEYECLKTCQARLLNPKPRSQALPAPLSLPQDGIGLSPPRVTGEKMLSLLLEPLLHGESDERAIQLARCLFGLGTQAPRRLSKPAEDHLLWSHGPQPETCRTRAWSWGWGGQLLGVYPRSQTRLLLAPYWDLQC